MPGDLIAIEEPFFKAIEEAAVYMRCTNCLKSNKMSLLPTDVSTAGMQDLFSNNLITIKYFFT